MVRIGLWTKKCIKKLSGKLFLKTPLKVYKIFWLVGSKKWQMRGVTLPNNKHFSYILKKKSARTRKTWQHSKVSFLTRSEFDSDRCSKCFGCLISTEAHGHDCRQVLLRQALCGSGSGSRAAARQHQGSRKVCNNDQRMRTWKPTGVISWNAAWLIPVVPPTHLDHPCGSWSSSWQHRFPCFQCNTQLSCRPPVGIPFHTTGTQ